jgi:hypothetical protein
MADGGEIVMGPWEARVDYESSIYDATPCDVEPNIIKIEPKPNASQVFIARVREISDANVQTIIKKNADYANPDQPFANFEASPLIGVSVARGMLVRMQDKMQRISNLLDRPAAVADESILDSLDDLSNYPIILRIWLEQNHGHAG